MFLLYISCLSMFVSEGRRQANEWPCDYASSSTTLFPHSYSISSVEHCCLGRNWNDLRRPRIYLFLLCLWFRSDVLFHGKCRTTVRLAATLAFQGGGILALFFEFMARDDWRFLFRPPFLFIGRWNEIEICWPFHLAEFVLPKIGRLHNGSATVGLRMTMTTTTRICSRR